MSLCGRAWPQSNRTWCALMGELATAVEDLPRYVKDGHEPVVAGMTNRLEWLGWENRGGQGLPRGLGDPRRERGFGDARSGAHGLPPGGKTRLRVARGRPASEPGNRGLPESALGSALALREVGGSKTGVNRGPRPLNRHASEPDTPGTFPRPDAGRTGVPAGRPGPGCLRPAHRQSLARPGRRRFSGKRSGAVRSRGRRGRGRR